MKPIPNDIQMGMQVLIAAPVLAQHLIKEGSDLRGRPSDSLSLTAAVVSHMIQAMIKEEMHEHVAKLFYDDLVSRLRTAKLRNLVPQGTA